MSKSSSIYTRVEPDIKEQAEKILSRLGIPMSNAVSLFLHQVVLQKGLPFSIKLPQNQPIDISSLTEEQFNTEIEKGIADMNAGRMRPADDVFADLRRDYGV